MSRIVKTIHDFNRFANTFLLTALLTFGIIYQMTLSLFSHYSHSNIRSPTWISRFSWLY